MVECPNGKCQKGLWRCYPGRKLEDRRAVVHISKFSEPSGLIENRIAGWMEKALEISGCKNVKILITQSLAKGASHTEIVASWA